MGTLQEVAGLILLQVNHNRECGKDDKFTKDEIADIIHRRVDKKDLIAGVVELLPKIHVEYHREGTMQESNWLNSMAEKGYRFISCETRMGNSGRYTHYYFEVKQ
jgi:hypothetical protein